MRNIFVREKLSSDLNNLWRECLRTNVFIIFLLLCAPFRFSYYQFFKEVIRIDNNRWRKPISA